METPKFSQSVEALSDHAKEYLNLRVDLLKLILVEKLSRMTSTLVLFVLFLIFAMFAGAFIGLAFVLWYGENVGPMWAGALIVAGVLVLKGLLFYLFRKKLLLNPVIAKISKIVMEEDSHD